MVGIIIELRLTFIYIVKRGNAVFKLDYYSDIYLYRFVASSLSN